MPFVTRLPALTGADPYPDALLALDFVGARRGPQFYKLNGMTTTSITSIPGFTYTGGASGGSYAAKADGSLQLFAQNVPRITDAGYLAEEARTNLLLNSATLSTQSVTTTATAYTLSFYGTGTVTLSGTSTAGPLVGTGSSARVTLTFTPTAGTLTLTVSGSVTIAQLEAGAFATSPIPTTSVAVTRSADVGYISGMVVPSAWTLYASGVVPAADSANNKIAATIGVGADSNNRASIIRFTTASILTLIYNAGSGAGTSGFGVSPGNRVNAAIALASGTSTFSADGNATTSAAATAPSGTIDRLSIGMRNDNAVPFNAPIRRIVIYPRAMSNSELQAITTAGAY